MRPRAALAWLAPSTAAAMVAATIATAVAHAAPSSPWEDVAHPNRARCTQLVDEAEKLAQQRQPRAATQLARVAVRLCPSDRLVLQSAGELLLSAHEYADARRNLERARVLAETSPATRERERSLAFVLGFAREVTGDVDGAIDEHRRLEAMGGLPTPNQYLVHYDLGDELMATGRLSEAIDEYRRASLLAPPNKPIVRLALAVALDRDEQIDQARAQIAAAVAFDPELRSLSSEEYVFVPPADVYYYRAVALYERGATAEARFNLRTFLSELPSSPYAARARERLAEAEGRLDPRELEPAALGADRPVVARALGPFITDLEGCLPASRVVRVELQLAAGRLTAAPHLAAATCLDRVLSRIDTHSLAGVRALSVTVPLAGRRGAASPP